MKFGIVVIGYDKADTVMRLLNRLNKVDYAENKVSLIVSIDKCEEIDIYPKIQMYEWKHGNLIFKRQNERLGLKNHVLRCGSYMEEYGFDAIAVFEDDMYPSLGFFNYMIQAVDFYKNEDKIAGISLYAYERNDAAELPFEAEYNGYDVYFMQYASSRGQIWLKKQWEDFMGWYVKKQGRLSEVKGLPENILSWPESSWLKYHMAYCVDKNCYFVYPYQAHSTCFGEIGSHLKQKTNIYQVPLMNNSCKKYSFQKLTDKTVSYDAFFEREQISKWLSLKADELCIDLYGRKNDTNKKYLLSMKTYPYQIVKTYGLEMYPHEINIFEEIPGTDIFLYDTSKSISKKISRDKTDLMIYYFRLIKAKTWYIRYGLNSGIKKLRNNIEGWRKKDVREYS